MKKSLSCLGYIIVYISIAIFIVTMLSQTYNLNIIFNIIYIILLCGYIFFLGNILDNEKVYKKNIILYIILYLILLSNLTLFNNRSGFGLINKEYFELYINEINFIPFKTIFNFISGKYGIKMAIYNIVGNFVMLSPLTILLVLKNKKYENIKLQLIVLLLVTCLIEFLQFIFSVGWFDIDDIILNLFGALFFFMLFNKFINFDKLRNIFCSKMNINRIVMRIIFVILLILIIIIDLIVGFEYLENIKTSSDNSKFYLVKKGECLESEKIELLGKNIYFHCVDIYYNTDDDFQMNLVDAFKDNYITLDDLENEMDYVGQNIGVKNYISVKYDISMVICSDNEIHFGSSDLSKSDSICLNG